MSFLAITILGSVLTLVGCSKKDEELPIQREEEYHGSDTNISPLRRTKTPMNSD